MFLHIKNLYYFQLELEDDFMSTAHAIQTFIEIALVAFLIWGVFNEDKFVAFEEKYFGWHKNKKAKIIKFAPNKEEQ